MLGQQPGNGVRLRAVDLGPVFIGIAVPHRIVGKMISATEAFAAADRPGHRRGVERQLLLDLVENFERIARLAVHLVDEGDDRDVAQPAHLEQLQRARLDALGGVDHHHGGVHRRQRAIGVVGEVFMARRVEQVEDMVAIFERHHGSDDRDAALALDLHPVRARLDLVALGLHFAGELDRAAEEKQLLGQRRLARVRVRNDRECAAARHRLFNFLGHVRNSVRCAGL